MNENGKKKLHILLLAKEWEQNDHIWGIDSQDWRLIFVIPVSLLTAFLYYAHTHITLSLIPGRICSCSITRYLKKKDQKATTMRTMSHTVLVCFNLIQMHMFCRGINSPFNRTTNFHHHTYKWVILYTFWYIVICALSGLREKNSRIERSCKKENAEKIP